MFEGEKTWVFWVGLIIFALSCVAMFSAFWWMTVFESYTRDYFVKFVTPYIVGAVVFIIIGFYMMNSGVKKQTQT